MKKGPKTPEEWAEIEARHDDLTRRLLAAIEGYRVRAEERRKLRGETGEPKATIGPAVRKSWLEMTREERRADRARSRDLDRRLVAAIDRYRAISAEKRRRREAEAS